MTRSVLSPTRRTAYATSALVRKSNSSHI